MQINKLNELCKWTDKREQEAFRLKINNLVIEFFVLQSINFCLHCKAILVFNWTSCFHITLDIDLCILLNSIPWFSLSFVFFVLFLFLNSQWSQFLTWKQRAVCWKKRNDINLWQSIWLHKFLFNQLHGPVSDDLNVKVLWCDQLYHWSTYICLKSSQIFFTKLYTISKCIRILRPGPYSGRSVNMAENLIAINKLCLSEVRDSSLT